MIEQFYSDPAAALRLRFGPLAKHIDAFARVLLERGYARQTARCKIRLAADLGAWLQRHHLRIEDLDEEKVCAFVRYRSRHVCICRNDPPTLRHLLEHLRETNVIPCPAPKVSNDAIDRVLSDYGQYLARERGLSQATLDNYLPTARCFLVESFGRKAISPDKLRPQDVTQFILRHARTMSGRRVQLVASALRSFFRFLYQQGEMTRDLAASVPAVSNWRLSGLPKYLEPKQVEHVLDSCNQRSPIGRRDYVILLLLARLGLRAGEVVHMVLDDIEWQAGELTVRGKSAQHTRLPIPHDVGEALANYLRQDRPCCSSRRVFLRMNAPRQGFVTAAAVCDVMRRALRRAGLNPGFKGAHLLRHSLATHMLRMGSSLTEIGEILRHQLPNTTEIYAKVDLAALRALAKPWKGAKT